MARPKRKEPKTGVKDLIDWGPGPRACQQLILGSKVRALLNGRFAAKVEDVKAIAHPMLRHRIVPTFNAEAEGITVESIIDRCIEELPRKKKRSCSLTCPSINSDGKHHRLSRSKDLSRLANHQVLAKKGS